VLLVKLISIIILLIIFAEDMRCRSVHWFWFPLLAVLLIALNHLEDQTTSQMLTSSSLNVAFLLVQLLLVTIYFSVKRGKMINITKGLLGWGDILFIVTMALYFPFINFIFFHVISLIVVLISWLIYIKLNSKRHHHVPLAGLQAVSFALLLLISCWNPAMKLTNDDLLFKLINR
jgi:hypothetical protein